MLETLRDVKFRTILIVAVVVWVALVAVWFFLPLNETEAGPVQRIQEPQAPSPVAGEQEEPSKSSRIEVTVGDGKPRPVRSKGELPLPAEAPRPGDLLIQAGSFSSRTYADRLSEELESHGFDVFVETAATGGRELFRVCVGPFETKEQAAETQQRMKTQGFESFLRRAG